jgi:hypothetical protein
MPAPDGPQFNEAPKSRGPRTKFHPLQGSGGPNAVGVYKGSAGGSHFFSAESTGGGETDSHIVNDHENFKFQGEVGQRYAFDRKTGNVGRVQPYNSGYHYGIPGAPLEDTPEKYSDDKYPEWTPREA